MRGCVNINVHLHGVIVWETNRVLSDPFFPPQSLTSLTHLVLQ